MMKKLLVIAVAVLLFACGPPPDPKPPPPPPIPGDACEAAGARLFELQCMFADGTPTWETPCGRTFADECQAAADDGRDWNAACIAKIRDCSELDAAYRGTLCH